MKVLLIANLAAEEAKIVEKVKEFSQEDQIAFLVGNVGDVLIPRNFNFLGAIYDAAEYGTFDTKSFDKVIFIKSEDQSFNAAVKAALKRFKIFVGDYRPFKWRRRVNDGTTLDDFAKLAKLHRKSDIARYVLEFDVFNVDLRFLDRKKVKLYLQRAFIRAGFPARKKKTFFTDEFKFQNWTYGIDYCVGCLTEKLTKSFEEVVNDLNESLIPCGIKATRLEVYSMDTKAAELFDKVMYEVQTDFDINSTKAGINEFKDKDEFIVKIKVPGMMRGSYVTKEVDARQYVQDIWAEQVDGITVIRAISSGNIGLYEILPTILHTSAKNVKRFPVRRLAFFKKEEEGELDFFAETCEITGEAIEKNVFDEPISDRFSARYLPFTSEKVSLGAEFSSEDEDSDTKASNIPADNGVYMENDGSTLDATYVDETPEVYEEQEDAEGLLDED